MNNQQKIVQALTKIKESQAKFKVKTSKYLKLLDIFKMNLTLEEIKLFLSGNQQLPYGLLYCCGNKSKVDSSLRKSAFYSTELLLSLFEKHPQSQLFIKAFSDLDDDDYKQMALSTHIMADKNLKDKGMIAYKIIKYLKDQRPHADLSNLLESTRLQTQFNLWYSKQKTQQIQEQIQQNTWKDQEVPTENNLNLQREQTKKQKKLEHISLQFDGTPEYLIQTFYNPFKLQQRISKSKKNREAALKKKQIADSLNAVVDEDSIAFLKQNVKNLEQIIDKIHLDSSNFDAKTFIKIIQPQINKNSLTELHMQNEEMNKNVVYYFIDDFFNINQGILRIQREFIGKEFKEIQKKNKSKDQQQFNESMIISTLQRGAFTLLSRLGSISKSMNELRLNQQNLRLVLDFIRRSQSYMAYPAQLKEAFLQRDNEKIIKLVQQFRNGKYEQITVFSQLNQSIELILKDIYEDLLSQIQNNIRDYQQLSLLSSYAVQLNQNAKSEIVQKLQFTILSSFNQYFNKQKQLGDYLIENIKGDYVLEFLQQCTQLPNNQLINVQIIEQYINASFKEQYKNTQQLIKSLELQESVEMKQQINETLLKFFEILNCNENQPNKNTYVKMQQDLVSIKNIVNTILQLMGPMQEIVDKLNEIEVKALGEEFKNVTLKQIKCVFQIPQKDFFGINFSQSVNSIIFELSKICKNRNVNGTFLLNLLMESLLHIKSNLKESKDYLIFLHNIRLIVQQLKEIGGNIYQITKKQINQKEFIQSLMNNKILQIYYQPALQEYVKLIPFELPLPMDVIPRPYIIDWLTLLNQQALIMAQLNQDVIIMDSMIAYVISIFFKLVEQSVQKKEKMKFLQQLHKEIGLFQAMTTQFQGQVSNEGFQRVFKKIQEYQQGELNDIGEWVKLEKYKMAFNFKALYKYY